MNQNFERAFQLSGQVALITGGGSGLGYATAKCMAAAGAVVVIMGRREEVLQKACAELGDTVHYIVHDITDVSAAQTVIDRIVRDYGSIDIIVNNAGRHCKKPVEEICIQDFKNLMDVHLYGGFALTQAAIPYMKKKKHGRIIFISSESALVALTNVCVYGSAKGALLGLTKCLAGDISKDGIRVNAIVRASSIRRCSIRLSIRTCPDSKKFWDIRRSAAMGNLKILVGRRHICRLRRQAL